jgi:hypothetical protein
MGKNLQIAGGFFRAYLRVLLDPPSLGVKYMVLRADDSIM